MKVLMTGADGFIGSNVLQYLLNNTNWTFTLLCSWRHMGNPLNIPLSNRVEVITHDLRGPVPLLGTFDYILHLASESHVDRSIKDPVNFVENNVSITLQILEYARHHMPQRFLLFSTDEVYGANEHGDWDILLPTNPYAASKGAEELIGISYYNQWQVPVIITNSNNIVGPNQHPEKFVPKIVNLIKHGKQVDIHAQGGKLGKRFYNPVENIGSALVCILKQSYNPHGVKPPRYSLTGGEQLDNLEMAQLVSRILDKKLKYKITEVGGIRPAYDAFYAESEDDMLGAVGWEAPYTLEEGLAWIKSM